MNFILFEGDCSKRRDDKSFQVEKTFLPEKHGSYVTPIVQVTHENLSCENTPYRVLGQGRKSQIGRTASIMFDQN